MGQGSYQGMVSIVMSSCGNDMTAIMAVPIEENHGSYHLSYSAVKISGKPTRHGSYIRILVGTRIYSLYRTLCPPFRWPTKHKIHCSSRKGRTGATRSTTTSTIDNSKP